MRALSWIRNLLRNERGNAMIVGAATLPVVLGAGALGLDAIQLAYWKRQLQVAADSAALAGTRALVQGKPVAAAATYDLSLNDHVPLLDDAVIENAPTAGSETGNSRAVRVVLNSQQTLPFWSFFAKSSPTIQASATAAIVQIGNFCLVALEDRNTTGISFSGNANLNLSCGVATNAEGNPAIDAGGSATIFADPFVSVGNMDTTNTKFSGSTVMPFSSPQVDPFAQRTDPSVLTAGMNCSPVFNQNNPRPGCYSSMSIDKAVSLPAGIYYIKNGNANFASGANVTGTGVTLVFTGDGDSIGKFDMDGQAELHLRAPTSGPFQGIVMFRDDDRNTMDTLQINGGQELDLEGAMYFPKTKVWFNGNSEVTSQCLQIVAQQLQFNGGANIQNNCASYGGGVSGTFVRLVE